MSNNRLGRPRERIADTFFYALERAIKSYRQFAQTRIAAAGSDVTIDQWLVLKTLQDNPDATQQQIGVMVIAPSRMERAPGLQVKTDRLDVGKMARKLEQGELKGIYVPSRTDHEKRQVVRSITANVRDKFNAGIAEVEDLDDMRMATLGITCVSNSAPHVDEMLANIVKDQDLSRYIL